MEPTLDGIIARRILLNFRADVEVAQRLLPEPLEAVEHNGAAVVGICLVRLEQLRARGLPAAAGLTSENMAHRIAVRWRAADGWREGVYVCRRDSDQQLLTLLGGRLLPGMHHRADFRVLETNVGMAIEVRTEKNLANVWFGARRSPAWLGSPLFRTVEAARKFFERADAGLSHTLDGPRLEGIALRPLGWEGLEPLEVHGLHTAFFDNRANFPRGSIEFDSGLILGGLQPRGHQREELPARALV